jgi:hypothetical protein
VRRVGGATRESRDLASVVTTAMTDAAQLDPRARAIMDGFAPATPTKAEVDLVQRLARLALTEGGLRLRPFRLQWFCADGQLWPPAFGYTFHTERPVRVMLLLPRPRSDLA